VARSASLEQSPWLPSFGWWPPPSEFQLSIILSSHHASVDPQSEFDVVLRGYADGPDSVWEHEVGRIVHGEDRIVDLDALDIPEPPQPSGGIVEVHAIRRDRPPKANVGFVGMWIEAVGRDGGGYLIPTIPIRGQKKMVKRDDLQVIPGIVSSRDVETEIVLLNPIDDVTEARLVASSAGGLVLEGDWFTIGPWAAWRGSLSNELTRVRQLLDQDGGIGSLAVYSSHKILPYFGFRRPGHPLVAMDHSAPIFA
jgi:hypothetical protein